MSSTPALEPSPDAAATARFGMWLFLASEILFFGVVLFFYGIARGRSPAGFQAAGARTDLLLGTVNTGLLLTSSLAVALAAEGGAVLARRGFAAAALLGGVFLAIKGIEYHREWVEGLFPGPDFALADVPGAELFFTWYFVATSLHALHLAIGIGLCLLLAARPALRLRWRTGVALYWHFVDLVWIFLYPLIYLVGARP